MKREEYYLHPRHRLVNPVGQRQFEMGVGILRPLKSFLEHLNLLVGESHPAGCTLTTAPTLVATLTAWHLRDKLGPAKHGWDRYESILFILAAWESHD